MTDLGKKLDHNLASALGSAEGWKRQSDKYEHAKRVAQARATFLESVVKDAQIEIEKPFLGDESLVERLRKVAVILDRRQPVIRIPFRNESVFSDATKKETP